MLAISFILLNSTFVDGSGLPDLYTQLQFPKYIIMSQ